MCWCVRPQPWRSFMIKLFCSSLKSKACDERKHGYFSISKLAKLSQKVKCSGRHVVCNYWWSIHSLLWFMQPTERRDRVKLHDILILIVTGIADSPGRVWWGGGAVKWARFMTMPESYCNDYKTSQLHIRTFRLYIHYSLVTVNKM